MHRAARRSPIWDIEREACALPRFDFIARFAAKNTRTLAQRKLAGGYFVKETPAGFVYGLGKTALCQPTRDTARLFDNIRRTPLDFVTRAAEDFRIEAHLAREQRATQTGHSR